MNAIDLSPLYRSCIGFDRVANMLDNAARLEQSNGYPPYNIEVLDENIYAITLAVAGFTEDDLDLQTERGVLTIRGRKQASKTERKFLHQGIATRAFERKFQLADFVEVTHAGLEHGLLTVTLKKEVPEAMKPKKISIGNQAKEKVLEHEA